MEALAPPDIEPAVVEVLTVPGGPWVATRYVDDPNGSIRVSATGGGRPVDRLVVAPTVLVECWHDDADVAQTIAREAYARLVAATGTVVAGVAFNHVASTLPNNNPDVNRPALVRFQFLTEIHSRLVALEV